MHKYVKRSKQDAIDALHEAGYRQIRYADRVQRGQETTFIDTGMYEKGKYPDTNIMCAKINYSEDHADPHIVMYKWGAAHIQKYILMNRDWDLVGEILKLERELS